jgi:hypothetical protein
MGRAIPVRATPAERVRFALREGKEVFRPPGLVSLVVSIV